MDSVEPSRDATQQGYSPVATIWLASPSTREIAFSAHTVIYNMQLAAIVDEDGDVIMQDR